jgi:hypothetical protein
LNISTTSSMCPVILINSALTATVNLGYSIAY